MAELDALLKELEEIHDGYRIDGKQFVNFTRGKNLPLVEALKAYASWLGEDHDGKRYSAATYNRKVSAAKSRIRYAFKKGSFADQLRTKYQLEEILGEVRLKHLKSMSVPAEKVLSIEEVRRLARETRDRTIGMMVRFLAGTGVRISEMLAIRLTDQRAGSEKVIDVRIVGKKRKERTIHVNADCLERIHAHFKGGTFLFEHDGRPFNRTSVTNRIKHESLKILGREVSAQQLRYGWAREQIRRGKSVRAVAAALGYTDPGYTSKFLTEDSLVPQEAFLDMEEPDRAVRG